MEQPAQYHDINLSEIAKYLVEETDVEERDRYYGTLPSFLKEVIQRRLPQNLVDHLKKTDANNPIKGTRN